MAALSSFAREMPVYPNKTKLLVYRDDQNKEQPVRNAADWAKLPRHILANMERVMGPLPKLDKSLGLDVKITEEVKTAKYVRKKLTYLATHGNRVPAYLLIPTERQGKLPAVLCLHPTERNSA